MNIGDVKPFGYMAWEFEQELKAGPPDGWPAQKDYDDWIAEKCRMLADVIWPRWVPDATRARGSWVGAATQSGIALTSADLDLMRVLQLEHDSPARQPGGHTNNWWFAREDTLFGADWVERFSLLFPTPLFSREAFVKAFDAVGIHTLSGATPWLVKEALQRPRAHQMAWWLGLGVPVVRQARSAWSPSAISGHAFAGTLACLNVYILHGTAMSAAERENFRKLAIDLGDRRVFAGVHYPSDNAGSWRVALDITKVLGVDPAVRKFLVEAIESSLVFGAMRASKPHAGCVRLVEEGFT